MQAAHLWIQPLATAIPSFPVHRSSRTSFSLRAPLSSPHPPSVSGDSSPLLSTTQTRKLNKYSSRVSEPKSQGGSQVILHGVRLSEDKPRNCIPSVWYEGNTFNMHLLGLSKDVREGASVREAGMVDVRFNTVRTAQWYDGNVSIPGCDKNDVAFFTDGRFSVASHGFFAGHICPEAQGVKGYRRNIDDSISISDATIAQMEASFYGLQIIPNADLEEMKELGSGAFGTVCHGKWRGTDVAVKRIKKSCFQGNSSVQERLKKDVWGEARMLSSLRHPNVVAFYGVVPDGPEGTLAIVTEFMPDGSLGNILLRKDRLLDRQESIRIALDAALGMEYLHLNNVVHFDIKCDNLLVNLRDPERPICKVGDFGLSTIKHNTLVSGGVRGTLPWMAPELLNLSSSRPSEKVDNYSFGIVMWEILTGEKPYANMLRGAVIVSLCHDSDYHGLVVNFAEGGVSNNTLRPPIPKLCDPEWKKLMEECWSHDPAARPSFTEITDRLRDMM